MLTISIVTPVAKGSEQYLTDAFTSLVDQEMPPGWDWEWVVQEDGETGQVFAQLPADPRISPGTAPRGRAATARNMALSRVQGVLVRTLDADDMLPPGALARDIGALTENPAIGWCVSPAVDLLPDGTLRPGPRDPEPGPLPPGMLEEGEQAGYLQVLGVTLCAYTSLVQALGGWQAMPTAEDVSLLLAAEAVADGWMQAEPGLWYRRWPGQTTAGNDCTKQATPSPQRTLISQRVDALKSTGWKWSRPVDSTAPISFSSA